MIPKFIKKYEKDLNNFKREAVKIIGFPVNESPLEDDLGIMSSKFLGIPFFPKSLEYPKDKNGKPMIMVAQINFAEIPKLKGYPVKGILQLFLSSTDWYDEDSKVIFHDEKLLVEEFMDDFDFLKEGDYEEIPIYQVHRLEFEKILENGSSEDVQFDFQFDGIDYWEFAESLSEEQEQEFEEYFSASGHKIGGYADFTQTDPREYRDRNKNDIHLLQIDTDDQIMFGDSGLGHIFIDQISFEKRNFEEAYFYWDCC